MKGIILAGGHGSRLYPSTSVLSKQLLPVYDKPMIYYPLSVLMLSKIKEILIISSGEHISLYEKLLGDGSSIGIEISYKIQKSPRGLADAFIVGEKFIKNDQVCLILGDNLIYGDGLSRAIIDGINSTINEDIANIFSFKVKDPENYGIIEYDNNGHIKQIVEKPIKTNSRSAIIGLYIYPNDVINIAKKVKPSNRGEIEISSINQYYLDQKRIKVNEFGRGITWLDTGSPESLHEASSFINTIEKNNSLKIACIEEIAYNLNYINEKQLKLIIDKLKESNYKKYLQELL